MATFEQVVARRNAANQFLAVEGLDENIRALRTVNREAINEVKQVYRTGGEWIARQAKSRVPRQTGKLSRSIKAAPTQKEGRVKMGTAKSVAYAGWVEFGGTILFPNRSRGKFRKGRIRVHERVPVSFGRTFGGFQGNVRITRRTTAILHDTPKRGVRGSVAGAGSGAVVASRPFVPEGRDFWPTAVEALPMLRRSMTGQLEALFERNGL